MYYETRAATGGRLRAAVHDADFLAYLVGKDTDALGLVYHCGEAAHSLRHEPCLRADGGIAHLAFELGLGRERGYGVEDDHVNRVGADEGLHDVERVFAGVGLL